MTTARPVGAWPALKPLTRHVVVIAVVAASILIGIACPAVAKTVPANTWAAKFCTDLQSWNATLDREGSAADAALSGQVTNLKAAKSQLQSFFTKSVSNTKQAVKKLQNAGTPDVPHGSKIAAKFVNALKSAQSLFESAESLAGTLSTSSLSKFEATAKKMTASLTKGGAAIAKSFQDESKLDTSGAFTRALHAAPECTSLGSDGTTPTTG